MKTELDRVDLYFVYVDEEPVGVGHRTEVEAAREALALGYVRPVGGWDIRLDSVVPTPTPDVVMFAAPRGHTAPPRADSPAWVRAETCYIARCSGCGEEYGGDEGAWHFKTLDELWTSLTDDEDDDVTGMRLVGELLLCPDCRNASPCGDGHDWDTLASPTAQHKLVWFCRRACGVQPTYDNPVREAA